MDGNLHRGVITGCNDAFIINASTREYLIDEDAGSNELIKPLLRGRGLRKWKSGLSNEYLITIASSINGEWPWSNSTSTSEAELIFSETYPVIYHHLSYYRDRLITRDDQGKFYWELRSCSYYDELKSRKLSIQILVHLCVQVMILHRHIVYKLLIFCLLRIFLCLQF